MAANYELFLGKQSFSNGLVDFYLAMISAQKSDKNLKWPKIYAYKSNYCDQLMRGCENVDKENERSIDLHSYDLLLFPILMKRPWKWSLVAIDLKYKTICLYQTKPWDEEFTIEPITKLLNNYGQKMNLDLKKDFREIFLEDNYLSQDARIYPHSNFDSGAFVCTCAKYLSRDKKPYYKQTNGLKYRHKIMLEVIADSLKPTHSNK